MRNAQFLATAAAVIAPVLVARADVAPPPPAECAPGFTPSICHTGPYCRPVTCGGGIDCDPDSICQDLVVCIRSFACGGKRPINDASPLTDSYDSECPASGTCADGRGCQSIRVCLRLSATTTSTTTTTSPSGTATTTTTGTVTPTTTTTATATASVTATATPTDTATDTASPTATATATASPTITATATDTVTQTTTSTAATATQTTTSVTNTATQTTTSTTATATQTTTSATNTTTGGKPGLAKSSGCSCSLGRDGLSAAWVLLVLSSSLALRARRRRRQPASKR